MAAVTLQVFIPSEQYEVLNDVAQRQRREVSEISAAAIIEWLEREVRKYSALQMLRSMPQRAAVDTGDGPRDLARDHDRYLYGTR